jgi:hypothetical protein
LRECEKENETLREDKDDLEKEIEKEKKACESKLRVNLNNVLIKLFIVPSRLG